MDLRPEECLYVGDHTVDVLAARGAGMRHLTVLTGATTLQDFAAAGFAGETLPHVPSITDVPEYVRSLRNCTRVVTNSITSTPLAGRL